MASAPARAAELLDEPGIRLVVDQLVVMADARLLEAVLACEEVERNLERLYLHGKPETANWPF